tara:strand:+ start:346 stop:1107 length:762 start_codon:yes stop_codon:yes gene_type:complete
MESLRTSDLHVSAIVQIGKLSSEINLSELAKTLQVNDNLLYIEFGSEISKGDNLKKIPKKKKIRKYFYNQVTLHINMGKRINMKIFNNGRIQMTGIKKETQGYDTIELLIREINQLSEIQKINIFETTDIHQIEPIETVLINSDFDIYSEVNREMLHRLIVDHGYYSSYEPCTYPGVNIKYYYNPVKNNFGICDCEQPCNGKGKENTCKKITIAVFKSGKIIITGGRNKQNIQSAYQFITEFINENKDKILIK